MKYVKKPIIVDAEQFSVVSSRVQNGVCGYGGRCKQDGLETMQLHIHTLHGNLDLEDGDWIIAESDGIHFYPCKNDIFVATYEKVEE